MLDSRGSFRPTKLLVAVSLCCASVLTVPAPAAAACQAGDAGCVLPVGRTAPPPPPAAETTTTTTMYEEEGGKNISWLLIALGLAAVAAAIFLLLNNDDNDEPVSP